MKICVWCKLAGMTEEEYTHDDDEIGGYDKDTKEWICDGCADAAQEEGMDDYDDRQNEKYQNSDSHDN